MRIRELTIRYTPRVGTSGARRQIRTAPEAAALLGPLAGETVEVFEVVLLDTKHRLIGGAPLRPRHARRLPRPSA
jgi:DNA repair protein RadC